MINMAMTDGIRRSTGLRKACANECNRSGGTMPASGGRVPRRSARAAYNLRMSMAFDVPGSVGGWMRRLDGRWKLVAIVASCFMVAALHDLLSLTLAFL